MTVTIHPRISNLPPARGASSVRAESPNPLQLAPEPMVRESRLTIEGQPMRRWLAASLVALLDKYRARLLKICRRPRLWRNRLVRALLLTSLAGSLLLAQGTVLPALIASTIPRGGQGVFAVSRLLQYNGPTGRNSTTALPEHAGQSASSVEES